MSEGREYVVEGGSRLGRRQVLQALALVGLAVAPVVGRSAFSESLGAETTALDLASQRLRSMFADPGELTALGRAYLAASPSRPDPTELLRQLIPPGTSPQRVAEMETEQLRSAMGSLIEQDLREGRILVIDGWLLSETELRLSALFLLTSV